MNHVIDFRSDTVTQPSPAMRQTMVTAAVGDDVWGDDPTVATLEAETAELLGKQAGLFVPSGTQSNLCALLSHCQRGEEYIAGAAAHMYRYEAGGGAVLGSVQPQPVANAESGMLDLDAVRAVIKPNDNHFAISRLVCVENTTDGKVIGLDELHAGRELVDEFGLRYHLDGARLWNAAVALGVSPLAVAEPFDSVSVCLSKGLGAPVGSVLVGDRLFIQRARRWRKMLGGGMRQAGLIAAAGRYALEHNIGRLASDHDNAAMLASRLGEIEGVQVDAQHTNMVFITIDGDGAALENALLRDQILVSFHGPAARLVTHLDVDAAACATLADAVAAHRPLWQAIGV